MWEAGRSVKTCPESIAYCCAARSFHLRFFVFPFRPQTGKRRRQFAGEQPASKGVHRNHRYRLHCSPLGSKAYKFVIPVGATAPVLQGHFNATGGGGNDVEVWVMNDDEYVNWQNKHSVTSIYNSGRITQGTVNISLAQPGTYYLLFNNRFSFVSPKAMQDNISLTYRR